MLSTTTQTTREPVTMSTPFQLQPGAAIQCLSIPITVIKEQAWDTMGQPALRCGFRIGGGIDQDFRMSPGFTDNGIYVTDIHANGPADRAGLRVGDKILQCNEYDFTIVTHKQAIQFLKKGQVANLLIARRGVT